MKSLNLIFLLLLAHTILAQTFVPPTEFAMQLKTDEATYAHEVITDSNNDVIIGFLNFSGTVELNPFGVSTQTTAQGRTAIIAKYDPNGVLIWYRTVVSSQNIHVCEIEVDKNDNLTVFFSSRGVIFHPVTQQPFVSAGQTNSIFMVVKYDKDGNVLWTYHADASLMEGTVNSNQETFIWCHFLGTTNFDPSAQSNPIHFSQGRLCLVKLDSAGNFVWVKQFGEGIGSVTAGWMDIQAANNHLYICGYFNGDGDFDPDTSQYTLSSDGWRDMFILKCDFDGKLIWAKNVGNIPPGTGQLDVSKVLVDGTGDINIAGRFWHTIDFDPGPGIVTKTDQYNGSSFHSNDNFILQLNSAGDFKWVRTFGSAYDDWILGMALDENDDIYMSGYFSGLMDIDPGPGTQWVNIHPLTQFLTGDIFVMKLDSKGDFYWGTTYGGPNTDWGEALCVDHDQNVYVFGNFVKTVDYEPSNPNSPWVLTSNTTSWEDQYLLKLNTNQSTPIEDDLSHQSIKLYPNPTTGSFVIEGQGFNKKLTIKIIDQLGREVYMSDYERLPAKLDTDLDPGIYFVQISDGKASQSIKLWIK